MKSADVSIVIPCYNHQSYVHEAIESALNQSYPNCEVIVIDDGSTDDSLKIIQKYKDKVRWQSGPNGGLGAARNAGIELAKGKYIKLLDADDILLPNCIETQVAQTLELPHDTKVVVFGDAIWVDDKGYQLASCSYRVRKQDEDSLVYILSQGPLPASPLHRRDYIQEVGGFDTSREIMARHTEIDLYTRLWLKGVEFIYKPCPVYKYRQYDDSNRLSKYAISRYGALSNLNILQNRIRLIESGTDAPLSLDAKRIFAQYFWTDGRAILREGYPKEAYQYFLTAQDLDKQNCIVGNAPYPTMVKIFGPRLAEFLSTWLRGVYQRYRYQ